MNDALLDRLDQVSSDSVVEGFAIAPGTVKNNLDAMSEGRVQVHIPAAPDFDPWARLPAVGGGSGRGFCWIPQIDDEVLVAFAQNDPSAAYVLGGLWSTKDRPPLSIPTDFLSKRTIMTGISDAPGHKVEFDDLLQSITITSSTSQKVTIDPLKIELTNMAGTLAITMDNTSQSITIKAAAKLTLDAPMIAIGGETTQQVQLQGTTIGLQATGPCTVTGLPIKLN